MGHNFERFCKDYENIENFEKAKADNFKGWNCHHRLETHFASGERRIVDISADELQVLGLYYRRPPEELIFLRKDEHTALHKKGKPKTEEMRKKLSETNKGKHLSEETRRRMSEAHKGKHLGRDNPFYGKTHSAETKKRLSEAMKGKQLTEETRRKLSAAKKGKPSNAKGMRWFNNGKMNIRAKECPEGFVPGILK